MPSPESLPDTELLERWRAGDQLAGQTLVMRHHASVDRFFVHKLGPDCEDLVQDTFLGVLEGLPRFRGEASFRTLLFAIARHKLLDRLRVHVRDRQRFDPGVTSVADLGRSPASMLEIHELNKLLAAALRKLPIDTQLMLELHYWEKLSINEIALVLELPANTVKTRMRRGRLQLDVLMQELAESPEQLESTQRGLEGWSSQLRLDLDGEV